MGSSAALAPGLAVERSATGRRWRFCHADERAARALALDHDIPDIVARLLALRRIGSEAAAGFLAPRLRAQLPDPLHLRDMGRAVERLVAALAGGETIAIFGDYDVDGATSAALLYRFLTAAGGRVRLYVPDRQREGYGPNIAALRQLRDEGAGLVVTVDCGTTAHAPLAAAAAEGIEIVVVDHHVAEPLLPAAYALVNPNRLDETSEHGTLAAVGVAFLLVVAVNRALRQGGWYGPARPEPDLLQWLDLVALGTVCDVVPLAGLNRVLVAQGIRVARGGGNAGLRALASVGGVKDALDAYHLGYVLGPRVNAGGRVGRADLGARLLATDDPDEATSLAFSLDALNAERRAIEAQTLEAGIAAVEAQPQSPCLAFAAGEGWHPGVIGIVAGRLKERYGRPACVVAVKNGIGKGSGRSVSGIALGPAIIAARQEGLLIDGGGHAMAAGFTVAADKLDDFRAFLARRLGDGVEAERLVPELAVDATLSLEAAGPELLDHLERLAPYGAGNPEPRFAFADVRVIRADPVGTGHVRCILTDSFGATRLKAIAFRAGESGLGRLLQEMRGAAIHVAGHLRRDTWNGANAVQLCLDDAAPASG